MYHETYSPVPMSHKQLQVTTPITPIYVEQSYDSYEGIIYIIYIFLWIKIYVNYIYI